MPWLYQIIWTIAIILFILAAVVFSVWVVLIGAAVYAIYRVYLYFTRKKHINGQKGQTGRIYYKVYTNSNSKGSRSSGGYGSSSTPRGFGGGEIIDMPVEEITSERKNS